MVFWYFLLVNPSWHFQRQWRLILNSVRHSLCYTFTVRNSLIILIWSKWSPVLGVYSHAQKRKRWNSPQLAQTRLFMTQPHTLWQIHLQMRVDTFPQRSHNCQSKVLTWRQAKRGNFEILCSSHLLINHTPRTSICCHVFRTQIVLCSVLQPHPLRISVQHSSKWESPSNSFPQSSGNHREEKAEGVYKPEI